MALRSPWPGNLGCQSGALGVPGCQLEAPESLACRLGAQAPWLLIGALGLLGRELGARWSQLGTPGSPGCWLGTLGPPDRQLGGPGAPRCWLGGPWRPGCWLGAPWLLVRGPGPPGCQLGIRGPLVVN